MSINKRVVSYIIVVLTAILLICGFCSQFNAKSIIKTPKNENSYDIKIKENPLISDIFDNLKNSSKCEELVLTSRQKSRGGVLIECSTRRILLDEGMHNICYPASTTKVLTALCVLQNLDIHHEVIIPKCAVGVEGSSLYLKEGQKLSVEDLLFGMMLRSGNDAAVALAVEVSGSVDEFACLMNKTAKECGAINSNFVNPHGLHDDNHYTTAYDLALITAKAYEYEDFRRFVDARQRKIHVDGEPLVIANKNKLLKMTEGANGVKTGFTKTSGRCLVGGAKRGDMQLISVVLNYNDMWNDTIRMLEYGFDNFEMIPLDLAMIINQDASEICLYKAPQNVDNNYRDIKFPLKKDGSERLIVDSGK